MATTVLGQPNPNGRTATPVESEAARLQREAAERAYQLQLEQQDYDRWLSSATQAARQPYLDLAMQSGGGFSDWTPPTYTPAAPFQAPDKATALNDPSYQFHLRQGQRGISQNASARGTGLTTGTLQELQSFGQDLGSAQYDKVYNQAYGDYSLAETLRGQAFDRTAQAGYQSASLRNQNAQARMNQYLGIAGLVGPGEYPGYHPPPGAPAAPALPPTTGGGSGGGGGGSRLPVFQDPHEGQGGVWGPNPGWGYPRPRGGGSGGLFTPGGKYNWPTQPRL